METVQIDKQLSTRDACGVFEQITGSRPIPQDVRSWCKTGLFDVPGQDAVVLEHVRNKRGHYRITELAVRSFVTQKHKRETELAEFKAWQTRRTEPPRRPRPVAVRRELMKPTPKRASHQQSVSAVQRTRRPDTIWFTLSIVGAGLTAVGWLLGGFDDPLTYLGGATVVVGITGHWWSR